MPCVTVISGGNIAISIAVDGPASSGKGTLARGLANALGYRFVDTGALYRAVAYEALRVGVSFEAETALATLATDLKLDFVWDGDTLRLVLGDRDVSDAIRTAEVSAGASAVAKLGLVRAALLEQQRAFGRAGGAVLDGRDIGTVVLPNAELKIFLTADLRERARRRFVEEQARGAIVTLADVERALAARDEQDASRSLAPLRAAADAVVIDSTDRAADDVLAQAVALARSRGA